MPITLDGTTGVTAATFDGSLDAADLTGNVAAARITDALNATGSAPIYATRAWVNFNGTGTVAIRQSGNVSSITDVGTGDYTVNFTTALTDANYSLILTGTYGSSNAFNGTAPTTTAAKVQTYVTTTAASQDSAHVAVAIHR